MNIRLSVPILGAYLWFVFVRALSPGGFFSHCRLLIVAGPEPYPCATNQEVTVGRRAHRRHVPARVGRGARARGEAVPSFRVQLAGAGHDPAVVGLRHVLSSRMYSLQVVSAGNDITGSDLPGDDDSYWHWLDQMHVSDFKRFLLDASSSREQDTMQQVTASAVSYPFKTNFQEVVSTGTKLTGDDLPGVCKFRRSSGSLCAATASSSVSSVSSVRQPTRETGRPRHA